MKRLPEETFEQYRDKLRAISRNDKVYLMGTYIKRSSKKPRLHPEPSDRKNDMNYNRLNAIRRLINIRRKKEETPSTHECLNLLSVACQRFKR